MPFRPGRFGKPSYMGTYDGVLNAPSGNGVLTGIRALLQISGGDDADTLNVDDTGDLGANAGTLTSTSFTGLGMAVGIVYDTVETSNISLGDFGNTFAIDSTPDGAAVTLNTGGGADLIEVGAINGPTTINAGDGSDTINVTPSSNRPVNSTIASPTISSAININLHDGNDQIYVSSAANVAVGDPRPDFLSGNLDEIQGALQLDTGAGRHRLFVSDATATIGDGAVHITSGLIHGLAPADITYKTDPAAGNFAAGITIWSGSGNDIINVTGTHQTAGVREITTLNTGNGEDHVTVTLLAGADGFFRSVRRRWRRRDLRRHRQRPDLGRRRQRHPAG